MSNIEVSAEDRERLAKSKFGEWFDEFFDKKFEEAFERKAQTRRPPRTEGGAPGPTGQANVVSEAPQQRRRSLLEECLTSTFGF